MSPSSNPPRRIASASPNRRRGRSPTECTVPAVIGEIQQQNFSIQTVRPVDVTCAAATFRLLDLPDEVVLEVAAQLPYTDVYALLRTNRHLAQLLAATLFRHACTAELPSSSQGSALLWAIFHRRHAFARKLLTDNARYELVLRPPPLSSPDARARNHSTLTWALIHMKDQDPDDLEVFRMIIAAGAHIDWEVLYIAVERAGAYEISPAYGKIILESLLETPWGPILNSTSRGPDLLTSFLRSTEPHAGIYAELLLFLKRLTCADSFYNF